MYRPFLYTLILAVFFNACKPKDNQPEGAAPPTISEEQRLISESRQYPDSLLLKENLIQFYRDKSEMDKAIAIADEVISKDSTIARFWYIRGVLYGESDNEAKAMENLERSVAIFPTEESLLTLGNLYAAQKDNRALEIAEVLEKTKEENTLIQVNFLKGNYYNHIDNKAKALDYFDECLRISYTFMPAYLEKGLILMDLKKYREAKDLFAKAVALQNNFQQGYYYLGQCFEKLNEKDNAIEAYRQALLYNKHDLASREALESLTK